MAKPEVSHAPDALNLYREQSLKHPILTAEQESQLSRTYLAGQAIQKKHTANPKHKFTPEQKQKIGEALQARATLLACNQKYIYEIALAFQGQGLPIMDLVNEGNIGFIIALARYKPELGYRLLTYVTPQIREQMKIALSEMHSGHSLPAHFTRDKHRLNQITATLTASLGRPPDDFDLSVATGWGPQKLQNRHRLGEHKMLPVDDPDLRLENKLVATEPSALSQILRKENREIIHKALGEIDPALSQLLRLYFGFGGQPALSLAKIGEMYNKSHTWVSNQIHEGLRQIVAVPEVHDLLFVD